MDYKQLIIDFVEGRASFEEFYRQVMSDDDFVAWFEALAPAEWRCHECKKENNWVPVELPYSMRHSFEKELSHGVVGSIGHRLNLHGTLRRFLQYAFPDAAFTPDKTVDVLHDLLLSACPEAIDGPEVWQSRILERIVNECPQEMAKSAKIKHIRARIQEAFHIENRKYPKWIQSPNWPVIDGRPMKFVKTTVKRKYEWHQHLFVDAVTGEERIVDDFD